ncbi:hypothetical protein F5Y15DRAFT_384693 [Xylariaceae sp. FL0016]|nr:hypothetical protein F5Y15DRAFT_384693 [Xylariaceae sp. FL0016]
MERLPGRHMATQASQRQDSDSSCSGVRSFHTPENDIFRALATKDLHTTGAIAKDGYRTFRRESVHAQMPGWGWRWKQATRPTPWLGRRVLQKCQFLPTATRPFGKVNQDEGLAHLGCKPKETHENSPTFPGARNRLTVRIGQGPDGFSHHIPEPTWQVYMYHLQGLVYDGNNEEEEEEAMYCSVITHLAYDSGYQQEQSIHTTLLCMYSHDKTRLTGLEDRPRYSRIS